MDRIDGEEGGMNFSPMNSPPVLGIFFRIPEKGKVKRRLAAEIGEDAALRAYESMLAATIQKAERLRGIDVVGFCEGQSPGEYSQEGIRCERQQGEDLGERMHNAFTLLFAGGYRRIVLIGSDSPDLPLSFLVDAFDKLASFDVVLGPAEDGGYYLIGMRKPLPPDALFEDIPWGSGRVLSQTLSRLRSAGTDFTLLPAWYDIDTLAELNRWRQSNREDTQKNSR